MNKGLFRLNIGVRVLADLLMVNAALALAFFLVFFLKEGPLPNESYFGDSAVFSLISMISITVFALSGFYIKSRA